MVLATTNRPWDLDEALIRRLEKRVHVPLPDRASRADIFRLHLRTVALGPGVDAEALADSSEGLSGADIRVVCREAAMRPMRRALADKSPGEILALKVRAPLPLSPAAAMPADLGKLSGYTSCPHIHAVPSFGPQEQGKLDSSSLVVLKEDLVAALSVTQPSVPKATLQQYADWDRDYGSGAK